VRTVKNNIIVRYFRSVLRLFAHGLPPFE
jgi:hypothetical protein